MMNVILQTSICLFENVHFFLDRSIDSRSTTSVISVDNAPLKGISSFYCGDNISNISMNSLGDIEVLNEEIENMESTIENEIDYLESSIEGDIDKEIDLNDNIVTECRNSVNITSKSQIITHVHEKDSEFSSIFRNTSLDVGMYYNLIFHINMNINSRVGNLLYARKGEKKYLMNIKLRKLFQTD